MNCFTSCLLKTAAVRCLIVIAFEFPPQIGSLCMNIVEHELKKHDMWREELQQKRAKHEQDKNNTQLKKSYDKSLKQFNSLVRKQEQLLRGW